jgi:hypothetical protein
MSDEGEWVKVEIYGQIPKDGQLNVRELPASIGFTRVALMTAYKLLAIQPLTNEEE